MIRLKKKPTLKLKHRPKVWKGAGKNSVPPRQLPPGQQRKPKNMGFELSLQTLSRIEKLSAQGMNKEQICYALDISKATLERRAKEVLPEDLCDELELEPGTLWQEAIEAYIKKGRAKGIALITNTHFEQATKPNGIADRIFWLKNNAAYSDSVRTEVTGKDGADLVPRSVEYTDEQRAIKIASLVAAVEHRVKQEKGTKIKIKRKGN